MDTSMQNKSLIVICLLFVVTLLMAGCTRAHKVYSFEGDTAVPYASLGTIEVDITAKKLTPSSLAWGGVEVATLSLAQTPSSGEQYKASLRKELARRAEKYYGADAVINVEYWPDPSLESFPEGKIYARGEMIKYEKFV